MIRSEPHSVNGKPIGTFYFFPDGRGLFLVGISGAKPRSLSVKHNAWILDLDLIRTAERRGCTAIGIAHRINKRVDYYIANIGDFLAEPSESHPNPKTLQRRLRRERFLVNTSLSEIAILKSVLISK